MSKIFDSIKVSKTVKSQVDARFESLNVESESTLGQASADSIADTKVIEKPQGSDAPRLSDQKAGSDPIEKRTSDENKCSCGNDSLEDSDWCWECNDLVDFVSKAFKKSE